MVSVCSHSGANNIRSSVLVELDLEEEYQRVNGVGVQSQRGQQYQVERAGGANNIRSAGGANNIRSSVLVGPTISGRCNGTAHK